LLRLRRLQPEVRAGAICDAAGTRIVGPYDVIVTGDGGGILVTVLVPTCSESPIETVAPAPNPVDFESAIACGVREGDIRSTHLVVPACAQRRYFALSCDRWKSPFEPGFGPSPRL
jgi:hypothetical protein